uniref:Uncharacterized protein n=1 Tax=Cacopsylla melanoneura TaxID=428564 RepID=A0A8D8S7X6_9HEMI
MDTFMSSGRSCASILLLSSSSSLIKGPVGSNPSQRSSFKSSPSLQELDIVIALSIVELVPIVELPPREDCLMSSTVLLGSALGTELLVVVVRSLVCVEYFPSPPCAERVAVVVSFVTVVVVA